MNDISQLMLTSDGKCLPMNFCNRGGLSKNEKTLKSFVFFFMLYLSWKIQSSTINICSQPITSHLTDQGWNLWRLYRIGVVIGNMVGVRYIGILVINTVARAHTFISDARSIQSMTGLTCMGRLGFQQLNDFIFCLI